MRQTSSVVAVSLATLLAAFAVACGAAAAEDKPESRLTGLRLNGKEPIEIASDKLEVKEAENVAIFTGNVTVEQGPTILKSGRMTVHYAKDGGSAATGSSSIDRLEVDGKVYVKSDNQVATGDQGMFDMKTETLVLSGKEVVLSEGQNVLAGCKLTVQMKTGQAKVDPCPQGRVQVKIVPGSSKKP
ncbi:MAG: LptA/OstA family protein [Hyphomicrobiales bacterium]|nr:LptA/OstA family protein [Hyphomicrobiales bacterium]